MTQFSSHTTSVCTPEREAPAKSFSQSICWGHGYTEQGRRKLSLKSLCLVMRETGAWGRSPTFAASKPRRASAAALRLLESPGEGSNAVREAPRLHGTARAGAGGVQQKRHPDPNASERWGLPCCSAWQQHLSAAASGSPGCCARCGRLGALRCPKKLGRKCGLATVR